MYARPDPSPITDVPFAVSRRGTLLRARPDEPREAGGVLNPGCARGRDGQLYLFPRLVAADGCSSIGLARVHCDGGGHPERAERLGVVLEAREAYERMSAAAYGCEDARVTYVAPLDRYVMTYVAITPLGPRLALAISDDLFDWRRLGLVDFRLEYDADLNVYNNKDGVLFPEPVTGPDGRPVLALLHRPMYHLAVDELERTVELPTPAGIESRRESIWISYADLEAARADPTALRRVGQHQPLAAPRYAWEAEKIGGGTPPVPTHLGWVMLYHGVARPRTPGGRRRAGGTKRYGAGVMVLDREDPRRVLYRSSRPTLAPETADERSDAVGRVVFPTGLDLRGPAVGGCRVDVYYGMADTAIGVGRFTLPATLPGRRDGGRGGVRRGGPAADRARDAAGDRRARTGG